MNKGQKVKVPFQGGYAYGVFTGRIVWDSKKAGRYSTVKEFEVFELDQCEPCETETELKARQVHFKEYFSTRINVWVKGKRDKSITNKIRLKKSKLFSKNKLKIINLT